MPIDEATWNQAAPKILSLDRTSIFRTSSIAPDDRAEFQGKAFPKTGPFWSNPGDYATRLSPDQKWLVLQSTTHVVPAGEECTSTSSMSAQSTKLVTLKKGRREPYWVDNLIARTGWLADRYFVIPTGQRLPETSTICEFGKQ